MFELTVPDLYKDFSVDICSTRLNESRLINKINN